MRHRNYVSISPAAAATLALALLGIAKADEARDTSIRLMSLSAPAYDFALNPTTGGLAAVLPEPGKVLFLPDCAASVASAPREVKVGRLPVGIVFKRLGQQAYFVVLCLRSQEMVILDASTLGEIKRFPLHLDSPTSLTTSTDPADPYVYYCGGNGHESHVARVSLEAMADEGNLTVQGPFNAVSEAVVSADGSLLYARGPWPQTGFQVHALQKGRPDGGVPPARPIHQEQRQSSGYLVDPWGQYVAAGSELLSADLKRLAGRLPATPALYMESRPVLVAVEDGRLQAISANSFRAIGSIKLPAGLAPPAPRPGFPESAKNLDLNGPQGMIRLAYKRRVLEDVRNGSLLVCAEASVGVVPLAALDLPDEPSLAVKIEGTPAATVGNRVRLHLVPKDPSVKLELTDGPRHLSLEGQDLMWAPTDVDVGTKEAILQVSARGMETSRQLTVTARRPSADLGFNVSQLFVSADGTSAVALGSENVVYPNNQEARSRIALVDLEGPTVSADKEMLVGLRTAAVDHHHVYAALQSSDAFYVLSRKDLSEVRRVFASGHVRELIPVGDRLLFVATEPSGLSVLKTPNLEPADSSEVGVGIHLLGRGDASGKSPPVRMGDGWWFDGCFYDRAMRTLRAIVQPPGFRSVNLGGAAENQPGLPGYNPPGMYPGYPGQPGYQRFAAPSPHPTWVEPWSVSIVNGGVMHGKRFVGNFAGQDAFQSIQGAVLPDQPAVAWLRLSRQQNQPFGDARVRADATFLDLITASPGLRLSLMDETPSRPANMGYPFNEQTRLEARPGRLVALVSNRIFSLAVPRLDSAKFIAPAYFSYDQAVRAVAGAECTLPLPRLNGAVAPVELVLRQETPGITLSSDRRTLRVNVDTLRSRIVDAASPLLAVRWDPSVGRPMPPARAVAGYMEEVGPRFEKLVGRKPAGMPVWISVGVLARDKNLQTAEVDCGFFVEVPPESVIAKMEETQRQAMRQSMAAREQTGGVRLSPAPGLERRLSEMEDKIRRLDAKLDRLTELLDRKTKAVEIEKK